MNSGFTAFEALASDLMVRQSLNSKNTYSVFDQSRPAGHSNAPVTSWLKPQSDLIF
jgi:hypothetical protein